MAYELRVSLSESWNYINIGFGQNIPICNISPDRRADQVYYNYFTNFYDHFAHIR